MSRAHPTWVALLCAALVTWGCGSDGAPQAASAGEQAVAEDEQLMPRLVGMPLNRARAKLHELGMSSEILFRPSNRKQGSVISQRPRPGTKIGSTDSAELVVAKGKPKPRGDGDQAEEVYQPQASQPQVTVLFTDMTAKAASAPKRLLITNHDWIDEISWSNWGIEGATGTGTLHRDLCDPNCAAGPYEEVPVYIRAELIQTCAGQQQYYQLKVMPKDGSRRFRVWNTACAR